MAKVPYALACGRLMYAMVATRLDIAHAMAVVSKFMSNLVKKHCESFKTMLNHLSSITNRQLSYGHGELSICKHVENDYAGCVDSRRSIIGLIYTFAGLDISRRSNYSRLYINFHYVS